MSFRHTFITDFIYQASEEVRDANYKISEILKEHGLTATQVVDERGYGYFAGIFRTLDGSFEEQNLNIMIIKLEKATKVPFRLSILVESGPAITYKVEPYARN